MTETERIELLEAVADCAPDDMKAELVANDYVCFRYGCADLTLKGSDYNDAEAIVMMLDAMDKAQRFTLLGHCAQGYICHDPAPLSPQVFAIGETRAEVVSRAFVAVFGGKE